MEIIKAKINQSINLLYSFALLIYLLKKTFRLCGFPIICLGPPVLFSYTFIYHFIDFLCHCLHPNSI